MTARRVLARIFVGLVGLVAAGATVLVLLGGGREVMRLDRSRDFVRPQAHVFRWLTEPALLTQWVGGLVEVTPLDAEGPRIGAQSRQVMNLDGRRWEMTTTLLEWDPPHRFVIRYVVPSAFTNEVSYTLTESPAGTHVDVRAEARFQHFIARLLSPLVLSDAQKKMQADFTRLKELVERDPPLQPRPLGRPAFQGCCQPEPPKQP